MLVAHALRRGEQGRVALGHDDDAIEDLAGMQGLWAWSSPPAGARGRASDKAILRQRVTACLIVRKG
jgi:hypothetical protein